MIFTDTETAISPIISPINLIHSIVQCLVTTDLFAGAHPIVISHLSS